MKKGLFVLVLLSGCITGQVSLPQESGRVLAFFCDQTDCENVFLGLTKNTSSLNCAIYHPSSTFADQVQKQGKLVVDGAHKSPGAITETASGLMHNKFCIVNESVVWTGSWNPAQEMSIANNVVLIESKTLARAFSDEFAELESRVFQRGKKGAVALLLNGNKTEAYFCPEDECTKRILGVLNEAKSSIHVMAYSFTADEIGALLERKAHEGVDVRVIFDPRKDDKSSEYPRLIKHSRIAKVHHKVFIIDSGTVITGSMNPTKNGDERNDENIVILRESGIAAAFEAEFKKRWNETTTK